MILVSACRSVSDEPNSDQRAPKLFVEHNYLQPLLLCNSDPKYYCPLVRQVMCYLYFGSSQERFAFFKTSKYD